jgi:hypothetical protein
MITKTLKKAIKNTGCNISEFLEVTIYQKTGYSYRDKNLIPEPDFFWFIDRFLLKRELLSKS